MLLAFFFVVVGFFFTRNDQQSNYVKSFNFFLCLRRFAEECLLCIGFTKFEIDNRFSSLCLSNVESEIHSRPRSTKCAFETHSLGRKQVFRACTSLTGERLSGLFEPLSSPHEHETKNFHILVVGERLDSYTRTWNKKNFKFIRSNRRYNDDDEELLLLLLFARWVWTIRNAIWLCHP